MTVQETIRNARKTLRKLKIIHRSRLISWFMKCKNHLRKRCSSAKLAVEETGLGKFEDKICKNTDTAAVFWDYLKDKKSVGII